MRKVELAFYGKLCDVGFGLSVHASSKVSNVNHEKKCTLQSRSIRQYLIARPSVEHKNNNYESSCEGLFPFPPFVMLMLSYGHLGVRYSTITYRCNGC